MKVDATRPGARSERSGSARKTGSADGAFLRALRDTGMQQAEETAAAGRCDAIAGVLAVQETPSATDRESRQHAVRRAETILATLDRLRLDIVAGVIPRDRLAALVGLLREGDGEYEDPRLSAVVAEIEVRAAVELAKRQQ